MTAAVAVTGVMNGSRASLSSLESAAYNPEWDTLNDDNLLTQQLGDSVDGHLSGGSRRDLTDDLEDIAA